MDAIVDNSDRLRTSLNAVKRETFNALIKGDYEKTMSNLEELSRRKRPGFYVELSMVLMMTAGDVKPMMDLAARLGFQRVIAAHSVVTTDNLNDESVKEDQHTPDDMRQLHEYAHSKGVSFLLAESAHPPKLCALSWTSACMTNGDLGRRIFTMCCSGIRMNLYASSFVYADFKKAWNSKRMQHIRETVNSQPETQNNMRCLCKQTDKTNPNWGNTFHELAASSDREISFNKYGEAVAFPEEFV